MKYLVILAVLTGCQTTREPIPDAPDMNTVREAFCGLSHVGDAPDGNMEYAYDPAQPDRSDTLQSVEQMIRLNETRNLLCKE